MLKKKIDKTEYITKSTLKKRGWTEKSIDLFLKIPDKEVKNPHYRSASPMKLYTIKRLTYSHD